MLEKTPVTDSKVSQPETTKKTDSFIKEREPHEEAAAYYDEEFEKVSDS